jgi:hypothetical protein
MNSGSAYVTGSGSGTVFGSGIIIKWNTSEKSKEKIK